MRDDDASWPQMMTPEEAAERLRLSAAGVRGLLRRGQMKGLRIGRKWFVSADEVRKVLREGTRPVDAKPADEPIELAGGRLHPRSAPPRADDEDDEEDAPPVEQAGPPRAHRSYSASAARMVAPRVIG